MNINKKNSIGEFLIVTVCAALMSGCSNKNAQSIDAVIINSTNGVEITKLEPLDGTPEDLYFAHSAADQLTSNEEIHSNTTMNTEDYETNNNESFYSLSKSTYPYSWPVEGAIIQNYEQGNKDKSGLKISAPLGTSVKATTNGIVLLTTEKPGYGKTVVLKHNDGSRSYYFHLDSIIVKKNNSVTGGQKIGTVGKSGNVRSPQLHFEIRKDEVPVDPTKYLG